MNKLFVLYAGKCSKEARIVANMCRNSFSAENVCMSEYDGISQIPSLAIFLEPSDEFLSQIKCRHGKYLVLGKLTNVWQDWFCLKEQLACMPLIELKQCSGIKVSDYYVEYKENDLWVPSCNQRFMVRYDYEDEWNNHGYGKMDFAGGSFDVAMYAKEINDKSAVDCCAVICKNEPDDNIKSISFIKKRDRERSSFVWINRLVGMVDSYEWNLVESFFANYRYEELPCIPYITDIHGEYDGAVTMRMDCDQAIASARKLWEMYRDEYVPMSLAITTGNKIRAEDCRLIDDVVRSGGSVLSHSMNHFPDWGGNYYGAYMEAIGSKLWLNRYVGEPFSSHVYAVSPFHQNPWYAIAAMEDTGYRGFVSGSIHNDPECVLARGGHVPGFRKIISLSNQCMLHGDCYHNYGSDIKPYMGSLDLHHKHGSIFGYLDHPFSAAYQYGWLDEDERISVHKQLIDYSKSKGNIWFCNLQEALDFVYEKIQVRFYVNGRGEVVSDNTNRKYSHRVIYKNQCFVI